MWSKIINLSIGSLQSRKLFPLSEISRPTVPDADLKQIGLLWVDLTQTDVIARRLPKKRYFEGNVTIRGPQKNRRL